MFVAPDYFYLNLQMMKQSFLLAAYFFFLSAAAQKFSAGDVVNAEKSFAAYSVAHGTKNAFLKFLDSGGVVFDKGKAVNGIEAWSRKEKSTGVLNWHPVFAGIAKSGDLGFTTGPWTFQPKTVNDSVVARGQYATLWKKSKTGEWKFIVDLGVNQTPLFHDSLYNFQFGNTSFVPGTWNNLLNKEEKFIRQTKDGDTAQRRKTYEQMLSKTAFVLARNGSLPTVNSNDVTKALQTMPKMIDYTIDGSGISAAGDLGYVYGTAVFNNRTENYLRLWRREGIEWRLVLEVLRY